MLSDGPLAACDLSTDRGDFANPLSILSELLPLDVNDLPGSRTRLNRNVRCDVSGCIHCGIQSTATGILCERIVD